MNQQEQFPLQLEIRDAEYQPSYSITDKIRMNLEGIDRDKWAFERLIIDTKYENWLRRRALIRSGHHTLHIEGNTLTEDEVADVLENANVNTKQAPDSREVTNWSRAMQFVDGVSQSLDVPITALLIRHIHQLILGPDDRVNHPGDYRRGDARVRHPITRKPIYTGPPAGDVPDLMNQSGRWLCNGANTIHPVLSAGIAHLRLVEIHPFVDGNGRTARALSTLILQRRGYAFNKLLALERYFDVDLLKYCETIGASVGDAFKEGRDLTIWLEYFTFAMKFELSLAADAMVDLRRLMESWHSALSEKGYVERHRDILAYVAINGSMRPRDIIKMAGISAVTATEDLKRLTTAGLLVPRGRGRARIFRLSDKFWDNL